jgi:C-terminal peptidase prc
VLDKINGILLKDLIYRIQFSKTYSKSYKNQIPLILSFLLSGELDSEVEITFSDDNNSQKTVLLKREGLKGELVKILDNAPPSFLSFEKKSINDKTGYISFNVFALPALYKFCEALTEFKKKENLVIDLRDNLGGSFVVLIGMIGMLNDKSSSIGTQIKRNTIEPMVVAPKPKNFKGKIVVLVDAQSVSAAEIFAAALQENNRAVIIGERSAGEVLPALTKRLNTGAVFLYPIANFKTPKGNFLEGKGVEPNILVTYEKKKLLEAKDAHLDKALAYFENEIKIESNKKSEESYDEPPPVSIKSPPPTPKPITSPQGSNLSVNINPQTSEPVENKQDEKALKIISDYIYAIGGSENIRKINSYTAKGTAELNTSGTVMYGNVEINHKSPNKISEVTFFDNLGEIRQVFDGKSFLIQSIAGGDVEFSFSSYTSEYKLLADFREILNIRENYPKITYIGLFDREGRETHLVEAVTKENIKVVFAFDAKTKFLVSRASRTLTNSYSDYRKVGDLMFPFQQSGSIIFTFKFSDVKFDTQIDDSSFVKKEYCYNTVN